VGRRRNYLDDTGTVGEEREYKPRKNKTLPVYFETLTMKPGAAEKTAPGFA
jgi:hypothetical protein